MVLVVCAVKPIHMLLAWNVILTMIKTLKQISSSPVNKVPPVHVYGGASAAVSGEAMGLAIWQAGFSAVTANLMTNYRQPVPLSEPIRIRGAMRGKAARRIEPTGVILLPDGPVAVFAKDIYAEGAHFIDQDANRDFGPKNE